MKKVAVFCSSKNVIDEVELLKTKSILTLFTIRGYDLIYGGSKNGLMGKVEEHFKLRGRKVTSVFPNKNEFLSNQKGAICTANVFERKKVMLEMADVYLVLSGGLGTFDELLDAIIYCSKNKEKQICIYNYNGFYNHVKKHILKLVDRDFTKNSNIANITFAKNRKQVFEFLIKKYKNEDIDLSTKFFANYFGISRVPCFFSNKEFLYDDSNSEENVERILQFLIREYAYHSKHSKKFSAIYWALIFTIKRRKVNFDREIFGFEMQTIYEQNSYKQSLGFLTTFEFEYYLFQNFSELDGYAKYFSSICKKLNDVNDCNFFVNACWLFVETFKEMENKELKSYYNGNGKV